jgi:hypothetical protein
VAVKAKDIVKKWKDDVVQTKNNTEHRNASSSSASGKRNGRTFSICWLIYKEILNS